MCTQCVKEKSLTSSAYSNSVYDDFIQQSKLEVFCIFFLSIVEHSLPIIAGHVPTQQIIFTVALLLGSSVQD